MCTSCVAIARPLPAQGTPRAPCRRIRIQATTPAWTLRAQSVANAQRTPMRTTTIPRFARPAKSVTRPCWMLRHPRFPRPLSRARRSPSLQCSSPALPLRSPSNHPSPDLRRPKCVCKAWHHRKGGPGGSAMPFVRYLEIIMPPSDSRSLPLALLQTARLVRLALPALLVLALAPAHAGAQPHQSGARAADADAPTLPLAHAPLAPQPPLPDTAVSPGNWQKAHEAVGAFPRGHADILAWERKQTAEPATRTDAGAPNSHSSHSSHGSHGKPGSAPTTQHPMHPRHHAPRSQP